MCGALGKRQCIFLRAAVFLEEKRLRGLPRPGRQIAFAKRYAATAPILGQPARAEHLRTSGRTVPLRHCFPQFSSFETKNVPRRDDELVSSRILKELPGEAVIYFGLESCFPHLCPRSFLPSSLPPRSFALPARLFPSDCAWSFLLLTPFFIPTSLCPPASSCASPPLPQPPDRIPTARISPFSHPGRLAPTSPSP